MGGEWADTPDGGLPREAGVGGARVQRENRRDGEEKEAGGLEVPLLWGVREAFGFFFFFSRAILFFFLWSFGWVVGLFVV